MRFKTEVLCDTTNCKLRMGHQKKKKQSVLCLRETRTFHDQPGVVRPVPVSNAAAGEKAGPFGIFGAVCRTGATQRPVQAIFLNSPRSNHERHRSLAAILPTLFRNTHNTQHTQHTTHNTQHTRHISHLTSHISHSHISHLNDTTTHNTCACIALSGVTTRHQLMLYLRSMDIALVVRAQQAV